jgi:hypothetical protein
MEGSAHCTHLSGWNQEGGRFAIDGRRPFFVAIFIHLDATRKEST